ncbi:MAG: hypothetical protein NXI23_11010 [Bacteroidetes bacterium]|jgi:hypothetical protein|nr:hypothetical protein [Bacteroidota bacterium]MDF1868062.1 hypothetical protein [Saprospiraceae bacterium]
MLILLLLVNPYLFGVNSIRAQTLLILLIFLSTFLLPAISVSMMKALGMVESFELKDKQERIGPYIITGIFYMWIFINFKNNSQIPVAFTTFVLGSTIALFIAFFLNIFSKISAHAVGMGGLIGMVTILMLLYDYHSFAFEIPFVGSMEMSLNTLLMLIILLAGIVGSSRLLLKAHEPVQIYSGYIVGFSAQFFALFALF